MAKQKRILLFGANGLLGHYLTDQILKLDYSFSIVMREDIGLFNTKLVNHNFLDLNDFNQVTLITNEFKPDIIINCSAYNYVDKAEDDIDNCMNINYKFVNLLADLANQNSSHLIHYTTDYVFDGESGPYTENDVVNPLSIYGSSKSLGENAILDKLQNFTIFRVVVLFGVHRESKKLNFVTWLIDSLRKNKEVQIVTDQISTYTYLNDLAKATLGVIKNPKFGIYHISGEECLSRYDLAIKVAEEFQLNKNLIKPIITDKLEQRAKRPKKSGFIIEQAKKKLGFIPTNLSKSLTQIRAHFN